MFRQSLIAAAVLFSIGSTAALADDIRVRIDGELIDIPVSRIKPPQLWPDFLVEKRLNEELFYGIDEGIRTRLPSRADALVKPR